MLFGPFTLHGSWCTIPQNPSPKSCQAIPERNSWKRVAIFPLGSNMLQFFHQARSDCPLPVLSQQQ